MKKSMKRKIESIFICLVMMFFGLLIFKFLPMKLFGNEILFDASMHVVLASFVLYVAWYFVDQNKSWRIPYFIFAVFVLFIIGVQRVLVNAHNDLGLLLGIIISITSIVISDWSYFHNKISF